ncbi:hypothetical protein PMIN01_05351 [Paraphaeosphaeria minitans]|uniref:Uncharacterized protein n=1 Tax=Paraphaeosphaeria minitans TaxID=565426 RepID=A0A9P6KSR7_9PLEO|nr:hypothetical protein PMIN01_05351 [Paraphaeosphaeria minitans]
MGGAGPPETQRRCRSKPFQVEAESTGAPSAPIALRVRWSPLAAKQSRADSRPPRPTSNGASGRVARLPICPSTCVGVWSVVPSVSPSGLASWSCTRILYLAVPHHLLTTYLLPALLHPLCAPPISPRQPPPAPASPLDERTCLIARNLPHLLPFSRLLAACLLLHRNQDSRRRRPVSRHALIAIAACVDRQRSIHLVRRPGF